MGIVVTLAMLLGVAAYVFKLLRGDINKSSLDFLAQIGLTSLGLWNIVWYGMRHLEQFWGQAAIITGVVMILSALDLSGRRLIFPRWVLIILLSASFLLYATTITRINLGLPIVS